MVLHIILLLSCIVCSNYAADEARLHMLLGDMPGGGGVLLGMMREMAQESRKNNKIRELQEIIKSDNDQKLTLILQEDRQLCDKSKGLVRLAACNRSYKAARLLIEHGFDVNQGREGQCPLRCAVVADDPQMVQILLDAGAELELIDKDGDTALHCACNKGSQEIFDMLLARGASVKTRNHRDRTLLHDAAEAGKVDIITALLPRIPCDVRDEHGRTPLMLALIEDHHAAAQALLQAGASVNAVDKDGHAPLQFAVLSDGAMVRMFLGRGVDVNVKDKNYNTSLHQLMFQRTLPAEYEEIITILLEVGALIDAQTKEGVTPLMVAEDKEHEDAALFLLEKGANPNICTPDGHITPLEIAVKKGLKRTTAKLLENGANPWARTSRGNVLINITSDEDMCKLLKQGMQQWQGSTA